jgi:hypothetical protein
MDLWFLLQRGGGPIILVAKVFFINFLHICLLLVRDAAFAGFPRQEGHKMFNWEFVSSFILW